MDKETGTREAGSSGMAAASESQAKASFISGSSLRAAPHSPALSASFSHVSRRLELSCKGTLTSLSVHADRVPTIEWRRAVAVATASVESEKASFTLSCVPHSDHLFPFNQ